MSGNTKSDLASGSSEGGSVVFATPYLNGQRGNNNNNNMGTNLDRSGSFREGIENRMMMMTTTGSTSSSRGSTTVSVDMPPLSQCLMLEPIILGDQKFTRSVELRRFINVSLGNTPGDHSFDAAHYKHSTPVALEELKRLKSSLLDASNKARDRVKKFQESIVKLDKYRHAFNSRKRRAELSSNERTGGANLLRMGNQIQQNPLDVVNQRLEDRTKKVVPNTRVRTSLVKSEGRNNTLSRQNMVMDKDRDIIRTCTGSSLQDEQKIRGIPAGAEGWEKKMKRKRSVGTMVTRNMDGNQEQKRKMHHKLCNDPRPRSSDSIGFGSGLSSGMSGINTLDSTALPTNSSPRATPRTEFDNVSLQNDKKENAMGFDKERAVAKANNKLNICEDNQIGSHSPLTKGKASRTPRAGSGIASSSPNPSTPEAPDLWEQPCINKIQSLGGVNNRKRPLPTESASPPVAQWVGQRPQKISRTRRANLVSPVSNPDEDQILSEGNPASDISSRLTSSETSGSQLPKGVFNRSQQFKMKLENYPSPARLSGGLESGGVDNSMKEKHMDYAEIDDRSVNTVKKVASFIPSTKKNKLLIKEEVGDGVRRQGRSGRGSSLSRASVPGLREKLDHPTTTKPLRSTRPGSDKNESKPGRPSSRKLSDRKGVIRPGNVLNSGSSDFGGESDDDHEELLAAANSAHNFSYAACSGSFWKKSEPIFATLSSEDIAYLKRQLRFMEELDEYFFSPSGADSNVLGNHGCKEESVCQSISSDQQICHQNGIGSNKLARTMGSADKLLKVDGLYGKVECENIEKATPLYHRVLSALIEEDNTDEYDHVNGSRHEFSQNASDDSPCVTYTQMDIGYKDGDMMESEVESEVYLHTRKSSTLGSFSCDSKSAYNSFRSPNNTSRNNELWPGDDELTYSEFGITPGFGQNQFGRETACTNGSVISSSDCQYQLLCLDDKLMLELQSIGLYPERVPDLAHGEEDTIHNDIIELKKGRYGKGMMKKEKLRKLDEAVLKGREVEERDLEQIAMSKLIEMAYKKQMACRGNNSSRGGVSKLSKQAALAFVKRTIARCRKFEESGRSCFSEPALRDVLLSVPPYRSNGSSVDIARTGAARNAYVEYRSQPESGLSGAGAVPISVQQHGPSGVKSERVVSSSFQPFPFAGAFSQHEPVPNRKKREVLLEDVGSAVSRSFPALGNTHSGGTKGRRSERDRDQNKQSQNPKSKPKQKIGHLSTLSTSRNDLLGKISGPTPSVRDSNEAASNDANNALLGSSKENGELNVFESLHLNDLESVEELGGNQDLGSWLNFDEDGLQDHDSIGLEIPMDDLTELSMLM